MSVRGLTALSFAVRPRVVLKYFGLLSLSLIGMAGPPALVALACADWGFAARCGAIVVLVAGAGLPLSRLRAPTNLQTNEALAVTALLFVAAAALMVWPFSAAGMSVVDAVFEAVSGITTTGLSTLASVEGLPRSVLFTRACMQWYGGLAIIVLALPLVLEPGTVARRFGESAGEEDLVGSTRVRARRALAVYAVLTLLAILALLAGGVPAFDAVAHGLAAVSTGGFSSHDDSLAGLHRTAGSALLTLFSFAGAISFATYHRSWRSRSWQSIAGDLEVRWLLALALVTTLAIAWLELDGADGSGSMSLADSAMLAVSAQTTTGFTPEPVTALTPASRLCLIGAMFIGGSAGSTAGGIKIVRFLLVLRVVRLVLRRTALGRHAVADVEFAGARPGEAELRTAMVIVLLYVGVVFLSWLPFVAMGLPPLDALFEVVSATGTVGLSAGIAGPDLSAWLEALLCLDMLMGRLEIVAVLVVMAPRTWMGQRNE